MLRFLPLVLKNCWRNRRRTFLTIASISVSMCLLGVMIAMYHALYLSDATPEQALRVGTRNKISLTQPMPESYKNRIRQIPGVREVMVSGWFGGTYKDPKNFFARFAADSDKVFTIYQELKIPADQRIAFERDRTGCVIGRDLATKYKLNIGDRMVLVGDIYPGNYEFTVRGIFGVFTTLIDDPESAGRIAAAIDSEYRNATAQTKTESEQQYLLGFVSLLGNVKVFLIAISGAVMFTILLVSANTISMSVRERIREVGVLKTLGFTDGKVLGMILGEAIAISLLGGTLGFLLSTVLVGGVKHSPAGLFLPPLSPFQPSVATACILTACVIGFVSSVVPALGASHTPIVDALRSSD